MRKIHEIKFAVGLSGGVDSAVTAFLLKQAGFSVTAIFMQNWDDFVNFNFNDSSSNCSIAKDYEDAKNVANHIGIPIIKVDFINEYWNEVFLQVIDDYKQNLTPNPDILCNKYIKFGYFLKFCKEQIKVDYVATGHYANVKKYGKYFYLTEAFDLNKDQTYFLSGLTQEQLKFVFFPLANLNKSQVREIAQFYNLPVWNKKDSTGICFIGEKEFAKFLKNYLPINEGKIIDIETNEILGNHEGLYFYTIGQRKGLNLSGFSDQYFVCKKDPTKNILYVTSSKGISHYLESKKCQINDFNWVAFIPKNQEVDIKFRHSRNKVKGYFEIINNSVILHYSEGAKAVTEGQYAVIYQNNICLGGGKIIKVLL